MAAVPQKTLNWLYNILTREYQDPNRTYSDLAHTLTRYPGFGPRTDVYTFENGSSALLAHFVGTIPVIFRGAPYRFPIALWIPHSYPYEAPLVYVTPTDEMAIRPGQHVGGDGKVYHHYLSHWGEAWDRSNIVDFLAILSDLFGKDPPVMSKQQMQSRSHTQTSNPTPPPRPPLPAAIQGDHSEYDGRSNNPNVPPPPPPKPGAGTSVHARRGRYDAPPPLPPQSPTSQTNAGQSGYLRRPLSGTDYADPSSAGFRQQIPAPLYSGSGNRAPTSASRQVHRAAAPPSPYGGTPTMHRDVRQQSIHPAQPPQHQTSQPIPTASQPFAVHHNQTLRRPATATKPPPPPVDLLDSPFDISLPVTSNLPPPPVPRNPEKDAVLAALSHALTQTLHNSINQNAAALPTLQAQYSALQQTYQKLDGELRELHSLNTTLSGNVSILHNSLQQADSAISSARSRSKNGDIPKVDEMLTAPTVVGKQLYDVVCEERGIEAGIRALQDGLARGRVGADMWSRKTRELAREGFRKKVLARKIGTGLGLEGVDP